MPTDFTIKLLGQEIKDQILSFILNCNLTNLRWFQTAFEEKNWGKNIEKRREKVRHAVIYRSSIVTFADRKKIFPATLFPGFVTRAMYKNMNKENSQDVRAQFFYKHKRRATAGKLQIGRQSAGLILAPWGTTHGGTLGTRMASEGKEGNSEGGNKIYKIKITADDDVSVTVVVFKQSFGTAMMSEIKRGETVLYEKLCYYF